MTSKFKVGDKAWVKAVVWTPLAGTDVVFVDVDGHRVLVARQALRPRVKRKKAASPWQPIETAPKDGTPVFIRRVNMMGSVCHYVAAYVDGDWMTDTYVVFDPTHWMPIPPLEVE